MIRRLVFALTLAVLAAGAAQGAKAAKPRPLSGCGVLTLGASAPLVLYAEPGVRRVAQTSGAALPVLDRGGEQVAVAATGSNGGWLRVPYDEAGREGWLEPGRADRYRSWPEFLPGRTVRLLPALKKGLYALRDAPGEKGALRGTLTRGDLVRVLSVSDGWARIEAPAGWFRWRDGDGRLTVSLEGSLRLENR